MTTTAHFILEQFKEMAPRTMGPYATWGERRSAATAMEGSGRDVLEVDASYNAKFGMSLTVGNPGYIQPPKDGES